MSLSGDDMSTIQPHAMTGQLLTSPAHLTIPSDVSPVVMVALNPPLFTVLSLVNLTIMKLLTLTYVGSLSLSMCPESDVT